MGISRESNIAKVIKWANGMVMVFDEAGEQMSEYQGRWEEVREKILAAAPASAEFKQGDWGKGEVWDITREVF